LIEFGVLPKKIDPDCQHNLRLHVKKIDVIFIHVFKTLLKNSFKKNRTSLSTGETRTLLLHLFRQKPDPGLVKAQSCISRSPEIYLKWSQKEKAYYKRTNPPERNWNCIVYIVISHATHVLILIQIVSFHAEVYLITLARMAMDTGNVVENTLMTGL